jgi:16S rRNA (guanine966-N2)-methyltransferase
MKAGMRVTGGVYRGRRVTCPPGVIRPAMDRMRESVFAILGDLTGLSFLDLFSGSGIIGIEAASRGASVVTLIEKDRRKMDTLKANAGFVDTDVHIVCSPVERFLESNREQFDLIFADPPFDLQNKLSILETIEKKKTLNLKGSLLIHYPSEDTLPDQTSELSLYDTRKFGRSIVGFYEISDRQR